MHPGILQIHADIILPEKQRVTVGQKNEII